MIPITVHSRKNTKDERPGRGRVPGIVRASRPAAVLSRTSARHIFPIRQVAGIDEFCCRIWLYPDQVGPEEPIGITRGVASFPR
jgi:hypothetical protein